MEQKYKILIVDDEQSILDLLKLQLEFENYVVYTAANATEALENLSYSPDIILLDINMAGMNGLDMCLLSILSDEPEINPVQPHASMRLSVSSTNSARR